MGKDLDTQVLIVGGGLAGASSALALAKNGISSIVVEPKKFPRDKPCGEGLLPHGTQLLAQLGLGDVLGEASAQPFRGILYRAHGAVAAGDFANDARGFGVRRRKLDARLHEAALATQRVELVAEKVVQVKELGGAVEVTTSSGKRIRAAHLIGADGPRSRTRHELGLDFGAPKAGRYALRRHFQLAPGMPMPDRVEVSACRGFEVYMTPVGEGVVGIAALCERKTIKSLDGRPEQKLETLLAAAPAAAAARLQGAEALGPAMACGPLRVKSRNVFSQRSLLVGDAAGYVDAITGEGMSLALSTSHFACEALTDVLRGQTTVDAAFRTYAKRRALVFRDHALLTHGLVFLARHPILARRAISRLGREPALFTRLLAVNDGQRSFLSLGVGDLLKLALGARTYAAVDDRLLLDDSGTKRGLSPIASA